MVRRVVAITAAAAAAIGLGSLVGIFGNRFRVVAKLRSNNADDVNALFSQWADLHNKMYDSSADREARMEIFKQNLQYITESNAKNLGFELELNEFADMTAEEFREYSMGLLPITDVGFEVSRGEIEPSEDIPEALDWRENGCVTPVKNQKSCGSCWAFATTGAVEGAMCKYGAGNVNLSEQELVDCAGKDGNAGCNGGRMDWAMKYVQREGLCSEKDYPYIARKHWLTGCSAKKCSKVGKISGWGIVDEGREDLLKNALNMFGPVSVGIAAGNNDFMYYKGGVLDAKCGTQLDHGVLVVGYGHDEKLNKDYWVVKNSWGPSWGESGYIRVARNKGGVGMCGIASLPVYAKAEKSNSEAVEIEDWAALSEALGLTRELAQN